jgi:hypothetical protein
MDWQVADVDTDRGCCGGADTWREGRTHRNCDRAHRKNLEASRKAYRSETHAFFILGATGMSEKEFLILHDYGQGGLWHYIRAESRDQILAKYSDLVVYEQAPDFLKDRDLERIRDLGIWDIDDAPSDWLAALQRAV